MSQAAPNTPDEMENAQQPRQKVRWPLSEVKAFPGTGYGGGMDLRDYFAAFAMQALQISDGRIDCGEVVEDVIAARSYRIADAMMKARKL